MLPPLLLLPLLWGGSLTQKLIKYLELQESVTVQEGLCVLVPCKVYYPRYAHTYLYMSWFRKDADVNLDDPVATNKPGRKVQKRTQGRFFLPESFQTNNCSLSIRDVNMADSGTYVFRVENYFEGHTYRDKMLSLKVRVLTQSPNIHIPVILESGHPRNLTCSVPWACEQGTPPIFFWNLAALTSLGPRTSTSSTLTLFPRPQDHGSNLTCQVTFPAVGVTIKRTVQLNVYYAPQNMVISIFRGNNKVLKILGNASSLTTLEGESLRLHCTADSNPPARLVWFRGFQTLNTSLFSNLGYMELPQVGTGEEGVFTCHAENELGSQHVFLNLSVHRNSEPRLYSEALGAVGGAGIMALLCLCILLVFRVKTQRKKTARMMEGMHNTNQVLGSSGLQRQPQIQTDIPLDHRVPARLDPSSGEEQVLHYAFLNFNKPKLRGQEDTSTKYAEIRTHK